jgi:hypothetical protein
MLAELLVMWLTHMGKGEGSFISFTKGPTMKYSYFIYKTSNRIWAIQTDGPRIGLPLATFGESSQYQLWLHNIKK